jgi:transposase
MRVLPPSGGSLYYAGLDLHKRYFTVCVLTRMGEVVLHHRRLPADLEPLQSILRELGGPVTVTVEATLQWAWLHDRWTQAGFPVRVAHPQQVKLISHARCQTDPIDARKLAELTRVNLWPTIGVPPPEVRAWRQLVRSRPPWCGSGPGPRTGFMPAWRRRISESRAPISSAGAAAPG